MPNIFLSHSSADKDRYVRSVADKLRKDFDEHSVFYDEYTFEAGMKSIEEITKNLSGTDIFVVFLSKKALESEWVKKELLISRELLNQDIITRVYPIVIDADLKWDNDMIPEWLKEYTLKYIPKPTKAAQLIRNRTMELSWDFNPQIAARNSVFVGRNNQIQDFENRKYDYDQETVLAYVAAGIPKLGRKSLLNHCFVKTGITTKGYRASKIELEMYDGIENIILWLNDLGFSDAISLTGFMEMSVENKCQLLAKLLDDLAINNEIIIINDNGCIITHEGKMCNWFLDTLNMMKETNRTVMGIASRFKVTLPIRNERIHIIDVPPLTKMECGGLLQKYLTLDNISLAREDYKNYIDMLKGFPEQVKFAYSLIRKYGAEVAYNYSSEIENYNAETIGQILRELEKDNNDIEFLRLLVDIDMISYRSLQRIVGDDMFVQVEINKFYIRGIIEFVGVSNEYIKINSSIKNYVTRAGYVLSEKYSGCLQRYVEEFLDKYEYEELEMPDYLFKLKNSLSTQEHIDNRYMIPSQYLKTMVELYEKQKDYGKVIEYADIVMESAAYIEDKLLFEIRYFLCMALAKRRDRRMLQEVQKMDGADKNFLLGFYSRMVGNYERALEYLEASLKQRRNFSKAKREKVQVLINLERFAEALVEARENYENDKGNPYHIHAYFMCLIKSEDISQNSVIVKELIDNLEKSTSDFGKELYVRCRALKIAYLDRNLNEALELIDTVIKQGGNSIYAIQDKFDICEHLQAYDQMENVLEELSQLRMGDSYGKERALYRMRVLYFAYRKNEDKVKDIIKEIEQKGIRIHLDILNKKVENILNG